MLFNNCWSVERRIAKYDWSDLYWDVPQPRPWQNSPCNLSTTRRPQDVKYKRSTSGALLYLWRQQTSVNSSPGRCRCRSVSRWRALPARRPPLVSPVAADIKISLLVLDKVCLVSATNRCFQIQARPQVAGGRAGRRQEQSSCPQHNMNKIEV